MVPPAPDPTPPTAKPASAPASSAKWRAGGGGGGGGALATVAAGAPSACAVFAALEAGPILRREQRGEHETDRASALRERVGCAERDGGAARGAAVGRQDVEARFGPLLVRPRDSGHGGRVLPRGPVSTSPGVATSLATVRIDTEASEPSASSAARASAPGSGVAAS